MLVNKNDRALFKRSSITSSVILEGTVQEVSPSCNYIKITWVSGVTEWIDNEKFTLIEVLSSAPKILNESVTLSSPWMRSAYDSDD